MIKSGLCGACLGFLGGVSVAMVATCGRTSAGAGQSGGSGGTVNGDAVIELFPNGPVRFEVYDAATGGNRLDGTGVTDTDEPCWLRMILRLPDGTEQSLPSELTAPTCSAFQRDNQWQKMLQACLLAEFLFDNDALFDLFQDDFGTGSQYDDRFSPNPSRAEPEGSQIDNFGTGPG